MFKKSELIEAVLTAAKKQPADLVIKNGKIVNVFTKKITEADVAIKDGMIVGLGDYDGKETFDAKGKYIVPGLIDGHMHVESTLLPPEEYAKLSLSHGVTTAIADPHEIGNVKGEVGLEFMLDSASCAPMNLYYMIPSCVPTTIFETNGATIDAAMIKRFYEKYPDQVLGLAEVMNFPAVANADPEMIDKLYETIAANKVIDGHAAGISKEDLNVYLAAQIRTDHEAVSLQDAKDRLDLGMYLLMRQGTAAKDLLNLLPAVDQNNIDRCAMVTDDKLANELLAEGSIDHMIRMAVKAGKTPLEAIQMATINPAQFFHLNRLGAIGAGYQADLVIAPDLDDFEVETVFHKGEIVAQNGKFCGTLAKEPNPALVKQLEKIDINPIEISDLQLPLVGDIAKVIEIIPNSLVTKKLVEKVNKKDGFFQPDTAKDLLKIAVVNRYQKPTITNTAIIKGFGLKEGAIATSIAHDSHNLLTVGTNDEDMMTAINYLIENGGGMVAVKDQKVIGFVPLKIGGLMSVEPMEVVGKKVDEVVAAAHELGAARNFDPFLTLSFMSLAVIPEIKLTDKGLFDFAEFNLTTIET